MWNPNNLESWIDHSHLDSNGIINKAEYIGKFLINNKILDDTLFKLIPSMAHNN